MKPEIVTAVREHRLVRLTYEGEQRTVEIHVYGRLKTGPDAVLCWQRTNHAHPAKAAGWRLLHVEQITGLHIDSASWTPDPVRPRAAKESFATTYATL